MTIANELIRSILQWQADHKGGLPKEILMSFNCYAELKSSSDFLRYSQGDEFYGIPITTGDYIHDYRLV